jgi:hypothetical protein
MISSSPQRMLTIKHLSGQGILSTRFPSSCEPLHTTSSIIVLARLFAWSLFNTAGRVEFFINTLAALAGVY